MNFIFSFVIKPMLKMHMNSVKNVCLRVPE